MMENKIIKCSNCGGFVYYEDVYCKKCGNKVFEDEKKVTNDKMREFACNLIINCEGNKFKAIKDFKENYEVDNDVALEYINEAYDLVTAKKEVNSVIIESKLQTSNQYINPTGIKKTIIVSQSSRKKVTSAVSRGLIGGALLGPVGLLAGTSAKSKETTTFQIIYNNGKQKTVTVENESSQFKDYCKYLDNSKM